ncbi:MAG: 50S ribosomal protein L29 [Candidatus Levyibacteriota bacterium]
MKKKDIQDLQAKTIDELAVMAEALKPMILKLKMDMHSGKVKNLNEARSKMKDRARMFTIISTKKGLTK